MSNQMWLPRTIERSRQRWLFMLRLLMSTFLALTIILLYINSRGDVIFRFWSPVIAIVLILSYSLSFFHYYLLPKLFKAGPQIVIQMFCDALVAAVIIVLTGGYDSTLNFIFLVVVINSAFLGGLRISFIAATLAATAWAAILDLHYYGLLPGLPALGVYMSSVELALNILVNTGATYLVAVLSGHLSTQLDLSSQALVSSQASLDRLSELNDNIIRSIDSGLITTDNQGQVLSINPAGRELLKVSPSLIFGTHWSSLFPELDAAEGPPFALDRPEASRRFKGLKLRHVRPSDGAELDIELSFLTLKDAKNEDWGHLMVIKDLTAMNLMESEIKRSEHMAAVGQLAAGLAHEIRTPLASMSGSWDMILNQTLKAQDQSRLMNIIGREMDRLEELVEDFLSFAKPTAGKPQALDLNAMIEDQLQIFSSWKGQEVNIEIHLNHVPKVYFDYGQLSQVIFNLIQNAIEAAEVTGKPYIIVETTHPDPDFVSLSVQDNGVGISEENVKRIFEPFFTTKDKGHGLGLAMVWAIINRGNGRISVRSTPNVITTFTA
ncbi:MAG: PAS domain-containing protein, partial [Deltaproteobacteria bacterium]|nr:PAS domain-containing protein [Deltaproteobacteria bacterium]